MEDLSNKIKFQWLKFSELTLEQLYAALALRAEVFVVEQKCPYLDPDGKDMAAIHLLGWENSKLAAYIRLFLPSAQQKNIIFGRVVTANFSRGKGYGKQLIEEILHYCATHYPQINVQCSAQVYLQKFYENFGFKVYGEAYDEDGIPHIDMKKNVD